MSGEKQQHEYNSTNGLGEGKLNYDPDLAHPAAHYHDTEPAPDFSQVSERKLVAKIDMRVIPVLSVMYLL